MKSRLSGYKKALGSVRGALRGPGRITEMNTSSAKERKHSSMNAIENAIPMEWGDIIALFREYNHIATSSARPLTAYIVYDASNWKKIFHESSRTYAVNSWSNLFFDGKISTSLFGDCLDLSEFGVRLDWYDWKREKCYLCTDGLPANWEELIRFYNDRMKTIASMDEIEFD